MEIFCFSAPEKHNFDIKNYGRNYLATRITALRAYARPLRGKDVRGSLRSLGWMSDKRGSLRSLKSEVLLQTFMQRSLIIISKLATTHGTADADADIQISR